MPIREEPMADEPSDERLAAILASVGEHLVVPPAAVPLRPTVGFDADRAAPSTRRSRRLLAAAAVVAIVAGAILLIPPARTAVADLLGIGTTRIEIDDEGRTNIRSLSSVVEDLNPISLAEATGILSTDPPDLSATSLGDPGAIYRMPEGGVLLAWSAVEATLWIRPRSTDSEALLTKIVSSGQKIELVDGLGTDALYIDGTHILQTPHRRSSAGSVLLWIDDDHEYRLEANMARADMIDLGRALE